MLNQNSIIPSSLPTSAFRLHEIATDCVCSAMIMLEAERIQPLAETLFAGVLQMGNAYHMAVALEDINAITNYARYECSIFCCTS